MRPDGVVIQLPFDQHRPCMVQGREQGFVQALVAQFAIGALHKAILHRLVRCDGRPLDTSVLNPFENDDAGQIRTVVTDNGLQLASDSNQLIEKLCDARPGQGCIGD